MNQRSYFTRLLGVAEDNAENNAEDNEHNAEDNVERAYND